MLFRSCDEEFPTSGWRWTDAPLESTNDVPEGAKAAGEVVNFWRHHLLLPGDGRALLFYNAGDYFQEKLFARLATWRSACAA